MEHWELVARESIRDLVARYNANGDTGRFDQVVELFAPDAVMDAGPDGLKVGLDEIRSVFTTARDNARYGDYPVYLRHMTATHQIDLLDESTATPHGKANCPSPDPDVPQAARKPPDELNFSTRLL